MKPFRNRLRDALAPLIPVVQVALITAAAIGNVLIAMSVFFTLWTQGMCLSPIPSMRWPPKPLSRMVGHCRASPTASFMPG